MAHGIMIHIKMIFKSQQASIHDQDELFIG